MEKTKTPGVWLVRGARGIKYRAYCAVQVPDPTSPSGTKWKWINKTFSKYAEAVAFKNKTSTEVRAGKYVKPSELTVKAMVEGWLEAGRTTGVTKRGPWKLQTYLDFKGMLDNRISPALGEHCAGKLRKAAIESAGAVWQANGLAAAQVNKLYGVLNASYKWALKEPTNGIAGSPMSSVVHAVTAKDPKAIEREQLGIPDTGEDHPDSKPGILRPITEDEVYNPLELKKLFDAARPGYEKCFVMVGALCGLRHGEINGLRWNWIDLKEAKLVVNRSLTQLPKRFGGATLERPKTPNAYRILDLAPQLVSELRAWKIGSVPNPNELVFVNALGKPATRRNHNDLLKKIAQRAGVKKLTVLGLRHTFASNHLSTGTDKMEVAKMMGHSSAQVTIEVYSHWVNKQQKSNSQSRLAETIFAAAEPDENVNKA